MSVSKYLSVSRDAEATGVNDNREATRKYSARQGLSTVLCVCRGVYVDVYIFVSVLASVFVCASESFLNIYLCVYVYVFWLGLDVRRKRQETRNMNKEEVKVGRA